MEKEDLDPPTRPVLPAQFSAEDELRRREEKMLEREWTCPQN